MRLPYNRGGLRSYLMLLGLLAGYTTPGWIALGTPFLLTGIVLHLWAKGCLHQEREVTATGPYRFVRHPFYAANAFLDFGISIMSGWWLLQLALPFWWLAVYVRAMRREEATMIKLFGDAYAAYRSRVPLLIPYRRPLPKQLEGFSWRNPNLLRTEVPRAFRFLSYPLMFVISYQVHRRGIALFSSPTFLDVLTVVLCVTLYVAGRELRLHFKHRRSILPSWAIEDACRVAILLGVVGAGVCLKSFEVETEWAIWPPGVALLGLSMILRRVKPQGPVIAEGVLAVGLAVLFELVWLAILLPLLYLALLLDRRLSDAPLTPRAVASPLALRLSSVGVYVLWLAGGVALSLVKEFWL